MDTRTYSIARRSGIQQALPALALSAFAAALVACGGGGASSSASGTPSTIASGTPSGSTSTGTGTGTAPGGTSAVTGAQTISYIFGSATLDGSYPYAAVSPASDGNLYGTTFSGGANNAGAVFKALPGGAVSMLYSFGSSDTDGTSPIGGVVQGVDGNLYGTTSANGESGKGTLFKLTLAGVLTTLHSFGADGDGASPSGTLVLGSDGNLYGTTQGGGAYGGGTIFRVAQDGTLTTLYSFGGQAADGAGPFAGLVQAADGNLYGTTPLGGANQEGAIFQATLGGAVSTLYSFSSATSSGNADGALPYSALTLGQDGALYGTTSYGGANNFGTAFKVTTGGAYTALHQFAGGADGAYPRAGLALDSDGSLLGTASGAGSNNGGTLFRLTSDGIITKLHDFASSSTDGSSPYSALVKASDGGFYGTTLGGGGSGTLFRWKSS